MWGISRKGSPAGNFRAVWASQVGTTYSHHVPTHVVSLATPPGAPLSRSLRSRLTPWVRAVVGERLEKRIEPTSLSPRTHLSLLWWALGITATARRRANLFKEAVRDGRGVGFAVQHARSYAVI